MKPAILLAIALAGCTTTGTLDPTRLEGQAIIAEMAAQTSFNAAKPHLTASQFADGQKALDAWLAALVAADNARKAGNAAAETAALADAAKAQAIAPK